jgi:magnesium chelatase family protein
MLGKILSVGVFGIDGYLVEAEFDVRSGFPAVVVVGLPDAAVKESKDRVATALKNSGCRGYEPEDAMAVAVNLVLYLTDRAAGQ